MKVWVLVYQEISPGEPSSVRSRNRGVFRRLRDARVVAEGTRYSGERWEVTLQGGYTNRNSGIRVNWHLIEPFEIDGALNDHHR